MVGSIVFSMSASSFFSDRIKDKEMNRPKLLFSFVDMFNANPEMVYCTQVLALEKGYSTSYMQTAALSLLASLNIHPTMGINHRSSHGGAALLVVAP